MRNLNKVVSSLVILTLSLLVGCNNLKKRIDNLKHKPESPPVHTMADVKAPTWCEINPNFTSEFNAMTVDTQEKKRLSTLSGTAVKFKDVTGIENLTPNYNGLLQLCENIDDLVEMGCNDEIVRTYNGKSSKITIEELLKGGQIYSKEIILCGEFNLKSDESLFLMANKLTLKQFSVKLEDKALLSISATELNNEAEFLNFDKSKESVFSFHIQK